MGSGGRLQKGKVLAPFLSMVIHGLLVTCFGSLAFAFQLLEMVFCVCVCGFECFTKVFVFLKRCFNVFESCFESVVMCDLKNRQVFCFASWQVIKSYLP